MKDKVKQIIKERSQLHPNDPKAEEYWKKLTEVLSQNESETIEYLKKCSKEEFEWISEVFEDIASKLQSKAYINCLKEVNKKYPDLNLTPFIEDAESYIE